MELSLQYEWIESHSKIHNMICWQYVMSSVFFFSTFSIHFRRSSTFYNHSFSFWFEFHQTYSLFAYSFNQHQLLDHIDGIFCFTHICTHSRNDDVELCAVYNIQRICHFRLHYRGFDLKFSSAFIIGINFCTIIWNCLMFSGKRLLCWIRADMHIFWQCVLI